MRSIALAVAVSLLGSSTAAAQPWSDRHRYDDRYERFDDRRFSRPWTQLLVRPTTRPDVDVVVFRDRGGRLGALLIEPVAGIDQIVIEYDDRPPQLVRIDRLAHRHGAAVIEVDRSARIRQIVIHGRLPLDGYAVFGS